ncbi:MAG: TlpA family protein disulfide reductase [Cyclobacteriaceae bacterium]
MKFLASEKINSIIKSGKPWLAAVVVLLILHYTGTLGAVSGATNRIILFSGFRDFDDEPIPAENFNYDFVVKDLNGKKFSLTEHKGKVIFLNLWATWCGPCRAEMPGIQSLYNKVNKDEILFVMLSIDQEGQQQKVKKYISDKQFTFPVYMPSGQLTQQLSVPSIPTTFIVNKYGKVVQKKVGTTNFDTAKFRKYLEDLTAE